MDELVAELERDLPRGSVIVDDDLLESYRYDKTSWVEAGMPLVAVRARSVEHVQVTVRKASRYGVPVVPRGAGSGLSGGAAAVDGCVVLSLEKMNAIRSLSPDDLQIEVEAGVLNADVDAAAREAGLWYAPDPASRGFSTIGGNIATNAGGLCCVKYGVTGDHVLGVDVVLADGSYVHTGRRTVKGVAGLDLTSLFVGSEGTLGVLTGARLRLRPAPPPAATAVAFFGSLRAAGEAVTSIIRSAVEPSLLELLDHTTVNAIEDWKPLGLERDAAAVLLAQSDAPGGAAGTRIDLLSSICEQAGATYVARTEDPDEGEQLLTARRLAYPALERLGDPLLDDLAVPLSHIAPFLTRVSDIADRHGVLIGTFGHAGDGNMHPTIVPEHGDQHARASAERAFSDLVDAALDLGGTITGEHGVGRLKRRWLNRELGPDVVDLQRRLKDALDPEGVLNPGKGL